MRNKALLLQSVSAIATAAMATGPAHAQSAPAGPDGYTYSVQGGAVFSAPSSILTGMSGFFNGSGAIDFLHDDTGFNAAFAINKQINEQWDLSVGGSINQLFDNTRSATDSFAFGSSHFSGGSAFGSTLGSSFSGSFFDKRTASFGFQTL